MARHQQQCATSGGDTYLGPNTAEYQARLRELIDKFSTELVATANPTRRMGHTLAPFAALGVAAQLSAALIVLDARLARRAVRQSDIEAFVTAFRIGLKGAFEDDDCEFIGAACAGQNRRMSNGDNR